MSYKTKVSDGTAALPGHSFENDLDCGFYRIGANNIGLSIGGTKKWDVASGNVTLSQDLLFTDATYDIGKTGATRPRDGFYSRNLTAGGNLTTAGSVTFSGVQQPTPSANVNDHDPGSNAIIRWNASLAVDLTGISGGSTGRVLFMTVVGSTVTIKHNSASSTASNRILAPGGADYTFSIGRGVVLWYDGSNWRFGAST